MNRQVEELSATAINLKNVEISDQPVRVAQILNRMDSGGVEAVVLNYYRHIDHSKVQFDFYFAEGSSLPQREELEQLGAGLYPVSAYSHPVAYHKALHTAFKQRGYKIVHAHLSTMSLFPLFAAWRAGVPMRICHNHSTAHWGEGVKTLLKYILRPFNKLFATDWFACGETAARWMYGDKAFDAGKVTVMPNAIDTEKFAYDERARSQLRQELGIPQSAFVVGHVGRFMYQKNHRFLVDIFADLYKQKPEARLLLIGEGELREQIQQQVRVLNLQDKVIFTGARQDVNKLYSAMDVFCLPSFYEGLGMVAWEAQVNGLPVVLSNFVPREAKRSSECIFLSLNDPHGVWIEALYRSKRQIKIDVPDIHECVDDIRGFYIQEKQKHEFGPRRKTRLKSQTCRIWRNCKTDKHKLMYEFEGKKMKPLISVVVPVYNVEEFLNECLQSIVNQTYKNIEVILLDDGSTDKSLDICKKFEELDKRIKVIHKKNSGAADSRNVGVQKASGEYITFVDSDDYIDQNMVALLYENMKRHTAEISICNYQRVKENSPAHPITKGMMKIYTGEQMVEKILYQKVENGACGVLIPSDLCKKISFPTECVYGEDLATVYKYCLNCQKVVYLFDKLYFYRQNPNSVVHRDFNVKMLEEVKVVNEIISFLGEKRPKLLKAAQSRKYSTYAKLMRKIPHDVTDERITLLKREMWTFLKEYRWKMIGDTKARLKNHIGAICTFLGPDIFCFL